MRLLIAEDEEDLAEALGAFFEKNHFSVDIVHDGRAACEYAESSVYDAIILDVMMPNMDGFTARDAAPERSLPPERFGFRRSDARSRDGHAFMCRRAGPAQRTRISAHGAVPAFAGNALFR